MFRLTFSVLALLSFSLVTRAQEPGPSPLAGKVEGKTYVSPTGVFKVTIPVLPELGGDITDTPNVVTFQDDFNVHVSIAAFQQDATQRWENSTRGTKDYLIYFFSNFVLADFRQTFEGVQIESAKYVPGVLEGSLLTYLLVPGGTMFAGTRPRGGRRPPPRRQARQPPLRSQRPRVRDQRRARREGHRGPHVQENHRRRGRDSAPSA
jgi:hypothetical protein